jgi:hypothetical protein
MSVGLSAVLSYSFEAQVGCFCPPTGVRRVRIVRRDPDSRFVDEGRRR